MRSGETRKQVRVPCLLQIGDLAGQLRVSRQAAYVKGPKTSDMVNGIVTNKLAHLDKVVGELRSLGTLSLERLEGDWMMRRAVERDLQVAVEILIDVCHRLLAILGQAPTATSRQAVERCAELGVFPSAQVYAPMVGFRNLVVHQYEDIKPEILVHIVNHNLDVLERFRDEVLDYAHRT